MNNKTMPQEGRRAASWWIRWRDLDWPSLDIHDDIKRRADEFAQANVNVAMLFGTHFRWDYLPFWTQLHDYMATVRAELNQRQIKLYDHHSAVYIHRYDTVEEMRNIKKHCGPHLPFCPDRVSAASWQFEGKKLNDWRNIDAFSGEVYYSKLYHAEKFCLVNPDFVESYCHYLKRLIADTQIDGLMSDDANFGMFCGCPACRKRFLERTGQPFPPPDNHHFWGNWANPAWNSYLDDRFAALGEFYRQVRATLPSTEFPLTSCCSSVCSDDNVMSALALDEQLQGDNFANNELVGNTPTTAAENNFIEARVVPLAFHSGVARRQAARILTIGYGFIPDSANALWSICKAMQTDCWFSTLKDRLGLPDSILAQLPGDAAPATAAFGFERDHAELFQGRPTFRCGVFFSEETRRHTAFGSYVCGYTADFRQLLSELFRRGLMPGVTLEIPRDNRDFPLLIIPSALRFTAAERANLQTYLASGGRVVICGPSGWPGTPPWSAPQRPVGEVRDSWRNWTGIWGGELPPVAGERRWQELQPNLFYHPDRCQDVLKHPAVLFDQITRLAGALPGADIVDAPGFFVTAFQADQRTIRLFFAAADYAPVINERLDKIRFHRSMVNLFTAAPPAGQCGEIRLKLRSQWKISLALAAPENQQLKYSADGVITLGQPRSTIIVELKIQY